MHWEPQNRMRRRGFLKVKLAEHYRMTTVGTERVGKASKLKLEDLIRSILLLVIVMSNKSRQRRYAEDERGCATQVPASSASGLIHHAMAAPSL